MPPPSPHPHPPLLSSPLPWCPQSDLDMIPRSLADQSSGDFQRCGVLCETVVWWCFLPVAPQECSSSPVSSACLILTYVTVEVMQHACVSLTTLTESESPSRQRAIRGYTCVCFPLCLFQIPIRSPEHHRFFPPRSKTVKLLFTRPLKNCLSNVILRRAAERIHSEIPILHR